LQRWEITLYSYLHNVCSYHPKFVLLTSCTIIMSIKDRLAEIYNELPETVTLVAVSKTKSVQEIMEAYQVGQRSFGENKARELQDKQQVLPKDIRWHFIGHLQTNKVKYLAPFIYLIESIDSLKLLEEIDCSGQKLGRVIDCLLQFHIATEETKFGLNSEEAEIIVQSESFKNMKHVRICGVMGMASYTEDEQRIRNEFRTLYEYFTNLKQGYFSGKTYFREISMGMSGDYRIAIEEGSTMVRIGSAVFGERIYSP